MWFHDETITRLLLWWWQLSCCCPLLAIIAPPVRERHTERERARARASPWGHTALPSGSRTVRPRWRWWRAAWGSCHSSPCTETTQAICRPLPNTFPQSASIGWTCSSSKTCFKKTVLPTKYLGKTEAMGWRVERGVSTCFSDNVFVECGVFFFHTKDQLHCVHIELCQVIMQAVQVWFMLH